MKRVTGIGGIFFKSQAPDTLKDWYKVHLGLETDAYGTNFEWRTSEDKEALAFTQWSPFKDDTTYFNPSKKDFMINYRVENLTELHQLLIEEGVTVLDEITEFEYGKFLHIIDPEGTKIELWEPNDLVYNTMVEGRTK